MDRIKQYMFLYSWRAGTWQDWSYELTVCCCWWWVAWPWNTSTQQRRNVTVMLSVWRSRYYITCYNVIYSCTSRNECHYFCYNLDFKFNACDRLRWL